jgi:xanthine dehydrogenase accessory factor
VGIIANPMSRMIADYLEQANKLAERGVMFVTVTLVQPEGHVPQDIGAKAIVTESGLAWGTVGGGRLEARAIEHALAMIARVKLGADTNTVVDAEMIRYELQRDLNMVCGGAATLFYEISAASNWNIAIFGAGHVAQATVGLLCTFACNVICIDHRQVWLDKIAPRSNLRKILAAEMPEEVYKLPAGTFYVCMSQGHATDLPIVRQILKRDQAAFIGVIGSEPKARTLRGALVKEGFTEDAVSKIHCPVGLPIGSNSPAEIAVSIAAQLLQTRDALA